MARHAFNRLPPNLFYSSLTKSGVVGTSTVTVDREKTPQKDTPQGRLMKAIVHSKFGPPEVLEFQEVEMPVPNETYGVLVKVRASTVNPADRYEMSAPLSIRLIMRRGLRRPKDPRLGSDVAGTVEAVGSNVKQFKPGDEVFGVAPGSYAEYAAARETRLALKPANVSFEEAAAVPIAGLTALQALRDHGHIQPGQKVLVNGAGGGVATFAVQIAKSFGAEVTAVTNTEKLELARALGADHVIDYTKEDFTKTGQKYDLICDCAATHSISDYKRVLNPGGTCVVVGFKGRIILRLIYYAVRGRVATEGRKFRFFIAKSEQKDLVALKELIEAGKVRPVVGSSFPLSETAEAMRRLVKGGDRGKIAITVG